MNYAVIQEFKGYINKVEFDDKSLFDATEFCLSYLEDKYNLEIDSKGFVGCLKNELWNFYLKYEYSNIGFFNIEYDEEKQKFMLYEDDVVFYQEYDPIVLNERFQNLEIRFSKNNIESDIATIQEMLDVYEFELLVEVNEDSKMIFKLKDNQGANWNDINFDEFYNLADVMERLDSCHNDYIYKSLEEREEANEEIPTGDWDLNIKRFLESDLIAQELFKITPEIYLLNSNQDREIKKEMVYERFAKWADTEYGQESESYSKLDSNIVYVANTYDSLGYEHYLEGLDISLKEFEQWVDYGFDIQCSLNLETMQYYKKLDDIVVEVIDFENYNSMYDFVSDLGFDELVRVEDNEVMRLIKNNPLELKQSDKIFHIDNISKESLLKIEKSGIKIFSSYYNSSKKDYLNIILSEENYNKYQELLKTKKSNKQNQEQLVR